MNAPSERPLARTLTLTGIAGAPGVAVGHAAVLEPRSLTYLRRLVRSHEIDAELARFQEAVATAQDDLRRIARDRTGVGSAEATLLEAYSAMVADPMLADAVERHVRLSRRGIEWALSSSIEELVKVLGAAEDPYLRERRHDLEFVGERLLLALSGAPAAALLPRLEGATVLVARDISPADLLGIGREKIIAIVTESGTRTSHTAIIARSLSIPCVLGAVGVLDAIASGDRLIVDGLRGTIIVRPEDDVADLHRERGERHTRLWTTLRSELGRKTALESGEPIDLHANLELADQASHALSCGAEGVGLYRTEYLFTERTRLPTEAEQLEQYRAVVEGFRGMTVTFRTFDVGADKPVKAFGVPYERNPALGLRAVRLALERPEIFLTQLRAIIRASAFGSVRVMVPMIGSLRELSETKRLFARALAEVDAAGQPRAPEVPLGMMVEVPGAALLADVFARHAAFFSLGTNDLVQYTLAVDRSMPHLAHLASPFDPAVLKLLKNVVVAASTHGRSLSVCGAMASDPLAAIFLAGLGVRQLSLEPSAIPAVKEALRRVTLAEARRIAEDALEMASAEDVERRLAVDLAPRLFDLLSGEEAMSFGSG